MIKNKNMAITFNDIQNAFNNIKDSNYSPNNIFVNWNDFVYTLMLYGSTYELKYSEICKINDLIGENWESVVSKDKFEKILLAVKI